VIVVNSFSKLFTRHVAWLVLQEELVRRIERLQQFLAISVPYLSQIAAEAAS
jgi:aspartate/methionine/tyrosine aminotransferase